MRFAELYSVSPDWFEYGFVDEEFVVYREEERWKVKRKYTNFPKNVSEQILVSS
jgi:hypothetical protein